VVYFIYSYIPLPSIHYSFENELFILNIYFKLYLIYWNGAGNLLHCHWKSLFGRNACSKMATFPFILGEFSHRTRN
jgi:hypothetical protein